MASYYCCIDNSSTSFYENKTFAENSGLLFLNSSIADNTFHNIYSSRSKLHETYKI
jgi:hypothetical protein